MAVGFESRYLPLLSALMKVINRNMPLKVLQVVDLGVHYAYLAVYNFHQC